MRQTLGSIEMLTEALAYDENKDYDDSLQKARDDRKLKLDKFNFINLLSMLSMYTWPGLESVAYAYTRGDDIEIIEKKYVSASVPRLLLTCDEIDSLDLAGKEYFWGAAAGSVGESYEYYMNPADVLSVIVLITYCIHMGVHNDDLKRFVPYLAPAGKSKIVDAVLSEFSERKPPEGVGDYQQTYVGDALFDIYEAAMEDKPKLIQAYLKNWLKHLSKQRDGYPLNTLGHYMRYKHKSPKTLTKDAEDNNRLYRGHWAWEIACLVKLQGIDDSSFRDHEWYPVELVDYAACR